MAVEGHLEDGSQFDSSLSRDQPFVFSLGTGQDVRGGEAEAGDSSRAGLRGPWGPPQNPRGGRAHLRGGAAEDRAAAGALGGPPKIRGGSPKSPWGDPPYFRGSPQNQGDPQNHWGGPPQPCWVGSLLIYVGPRVLGGPPPKNVGGQ
ncbi:peptidyl-prolyl cis-trans isomerase FKBP2 isoform X3 [Mycteria americana]|uniref:peptidyl-prolyl cis-trans isomerase FKBP2 isoform X3 n=1 Tax=Mycteria americana TaxID=33587 RepID=UPI003F58E03A